MLAVSATLIAVNWLLFIHSVQVGHALEASLGYYVFPLCAVALGYLVLGERFTRVQRLAIALAVLAVVVLAVGLGAAPWIALTLAVDLLALRGDQGAGAAGAGADRAGRDADPRAAGRWSGSWGMHSTAGTTSTGGPAGSSGAISAPACCSPAPG